MIRADVNDAGDGFVEINSKDVLVEMCLLIQEVYNEIDEMSINDLFRAIEIATDIEIRNLEYIPNDASLYLS
jgi:hypothetical protein